jgi:type I restriction enzyme, S subunit
VKAEWEYARLADVCYKVTQGPNPKYDKNGNVRFRVLKTKDLYDTTIHYDRADCVSEAVFSNHLSAELRSGDVLLAIVGQGSINKCNVFEARDDARFIFTRALGLIRPIPTKLDAHFLKHFLQSSFGKEMIDAGIGGTSGQQVVTTTHLKSLSIPLPPLKEQQRIVAVLDEAFEGLARARVHAEANLQNARELFVQELRGVFSVGKEGWTKGKIEGLCRIRSGTTVSKALERPTGDFPYVKVADMNLVENLDGIVTSTRFLSAKDVPDPQIIPAGATIFPKRGGAILTNKKRKLLTDICADLNVMGVIPGNELDEDFLHFYFLSIDMREIGSGSSVPQINNYDINPLILLFPADRVEQAEVAETLQLLKDQTVTLAKAYKAKLSHIDALRQSLLQKAFAGELT